MAYDYSRVQQAISNARRICAKTRLLLEDSRRVTAGITARRPGARLSWQAAMALRTPRHFAVAGMINGWDPVSREITIGTQTFTASAEVSVIGLARRRHVLMSGEQPATRSPHVVNRILVRRLVA